MEMRSLIPWGRERRLPVNRMGEETSPFEALHRQVNRLFDDFWRDFDTPFGHRAWSMQWPNIAVSETDKEVKVLAELPGLSEKDVDVTLREGVLTLKGEKKTETKTSDYSEIWHGSFERSVDVGEVDPDKVQATFTNGMLTVTLNKRPDAQTRTKRIQINGP